MQVGVKMNEVQMKQVPIKGLKMSIEIKETSVC